MERDEANKRIDELARRSGRFETDVKERFDKVDHQFDRVDRQFDKIDRRFERFEARVDARFREMAGEMVTKEELARIDARLDHWGKVVSGGVVAIVGTVIAKVLGL